MIPQHEYSGKAGPCLIIPPDYWNDGTNSDASVQLSVSASPTDSESFNARDDYARHNEMESECVTIGDPSWVARPRNAFIIFRCEYARLHSRMGRRVKGEAGASAEKSLSKRAAEAWHQLSREEKDHFKALADQERREHARLHPDYRFRPMKRLLPKRTPHHRLVSLSNLLEQRSDNGMHKNDSRQETAPPGSPNPGDFSDDVIRRTSSLFSPRSCEVLSDAESCTSDLPLKSTELWSSPSTSPVIPSPSQEGMIHPLLSSPDFDAGSLNELSYAHHQECVLPPSPQFCDTANLCILHNSVPLSSMSPPSSLANWDGKAPDRLGSCATDGCDQSPEYASALSSVYLPKDNYDSNICIGKGFGAQLSDKESTSFLYTDPHVPQTECLYDPTNLTVPAAIESQSICMSCSTSTFDESMIGIDTLFYIR